MATSETNTDFLRFSAYSIKDAITRKLSEDTKFTDQVYEGSNLAILIDIVSYMYQCLLFQLNSAASESMFSDTQIYDNITRLVKFIGYNPKGCTAASIPVYVNANTTNLGNDNIRSYWIPQYTKINTGLTDSNGKPIFYSFPSNGTVVDNSTFFNIKENGSQAFTLYNGQWRMYETVFTASGIDNETFYLSGLKSDADDNQYVAHDFIDVYVGHYNAEEKDFTREKWEMDKNGIFTGYDVSSGKSESSIKLFNNQTAFKSIYPGSYKIYTVQLNEDKTYSIKFGNGIVGQKLSKGDKIYVFYLQTNGPDGKIDTSNIDIQKIKFVPHDPNMFGISQYLYDSIFNINNNKNSVNPVEKNLTIEDNKNKYILTFGLQESTTPLNEESVEEIRYNAPLWFTTGNRLVTKQDYEYYIKNTRNSSTSIGCDVVDCKCMNNWDYMGTFYKWLYDLGQNGKWIEYKEKGLIKYADEDCVRNPSRYLNKDVFTRFDYFYADAADANNLYIWIKSTNDDFNAATVTNNINVVLNPIKIMTAELVACKALNVFFDICAAPVEYMLDNYFAGGSVNEKTFDSIGESYVEVTLDDNMLFAPHSLQAQIANIILDYFSVNNCSLGQIVEYDKILNSIYEINGVQKIRTVFVPSDNSVKTRVYDGLSFASWTSADNLIKTGDDISISNTIRHLEDFQFPKFANKDNLLNKIKVIKKSLSTVTTIKF